jgi:radical SAM superfamily enzyme YgiQ (UPF0313 family)
MREMRLARAHVERRLALAVERGVLPKVDVQRTLCILERAIGDDIRHTIARRREQYAWIDNLAKAADALLDQCVEVEGEPAPRLLFGARVTALAPEIAEEVRYGHGIDGFVAGYAERTFVELLGAVLDGSSWPTSVFAAGSHAWKRATGILETTPAFGSLRDYGAPRLTLPAQVTRGCAYGRCEFCTYPAVEGAVVEPTALHHLEPVVAEAVARGAVVSFKDALMTPPFLRKVASLIAGRARWSACTKVAPALVELLPVLAASGCETLEVGIETLVERSQLVINKKVTRGLVDALLRAAQAVGVRIVVNYMTGLPFEDPRDAADCYGWIQNLAAKTGAVVEHHEFEAERRAKIVRHLRVTATWPWSSVVAWQPISATEAA